MERLPLNDDGLEEVSPYLDLSVTDRQISCQTFHFYDPYRMGLSTLENLGNTCFFNTVMQCLAHTPPLQRIVMNGRYSTQNRLWREFVKLMKTMWHSNYRLSPKSMYTSFALEFKKYDHNQEDAHEILLFILNRFHDALKYKVTFKDNTNNVHPQVMTSLKQLNDSTQGSIVNQIFLGQLQQRIECSECGTVSCNYPTFLDLVLRLDHQDDRYQNINALLLSYCGTETLEGDEAYNCDKCNKKVKAFKKTTFWRMPECLIIVLGRFDWRGNKNEQKIDYPIVNLDLTDRVTYPNKSIHLYDLYAVSCHVGNTRGGHYYTVANANDRWVVLNDERFRYIRQLDNVVTQQAYILFYRRKAAV